MFKNRKKRKSVIEKEKFSLISHNKKDNNSKIKSNKKEYNNKKPSKIILDEEEDEDEKINEIINVSQNSKNLKPIKYPKEDISFLDSLSTNKTEDNPKVKSALKQKKKKG